jgi:LysM repeat protein
VALVYVPSSARPAAVRSAASVYARRRLVALLLLVAVVVVSAQGLLSVVSHGATSGLAPATSVHIVQPGESLWSIAQQERPTADMSRLVDELLRLNGSSTLQVGQRLVLPS